MAEVLLVVHGEADPSRYQDGDIAIAFNQRRIRQVHAQHICHVRLVPFNSDGLNPVGSLAYEYENLTRQFLFTRVGPTAVLRWDRLTDEQTVSVEPNLEQWLRLRLSSPEHKIYGTRGAEIWFGGRSDVSHGVLDKVWSHIEGHTSNLEVNHQRFPLGTRDKKRFLALPTLDFSDVQKDAYSAPLFDAEGLKVAARAHGVDYQARLSVKELEDVKNDEIEVDFRDSKIDLDLTVETRTKSVEEVRSRVRTFNLG